VRFTFIDALRGLAALWVAGFHFYGGLTTYFAPGPFAEPFHSFLLHGNCGVEIFFVISGFVIAYTIREVRITPAYLGNFVLRRSVRLEPPYWATIVLAVGLQYLAHRLHPERSATLPSWTQILAHVVYLQDLLNQGDIVDVFWTLCMEVQFYLSFLLLIGLIPGLARWFHLRELGRMRVGVFVLGALAAWSLAVQGEFIASPHRGFMIKFWYLFQLGVLAWWTLSGVAKPRHFAIYVVVLLLLLARRFSVESLIGILTGVSLVVVGRLNRLDRWLSGPVMQYFGRISYSLYLVHAVVGTVFTYFLAQRVSASTSGLVPALALFAGAYAASVATAHLLYRWVEKPSVQLSRRLKIEVQSPTAGLRTEERDTKPGSVCGEFFPLPSELDILAVATDEAG
jgi:peptidoglycan/LPS O-acetylase OafA/YrhL